ncbi:hypothetical protein E3Q17_03752 [Wallemia mellicola]|uniref:PAC domain-containing protein n=2 Tax=Wallemia mellicola TaxID=1708541 RepID=A0A4V4MLR2_9BASI|nr:hypothetical protein E3Q24_03761 [Wallemia mellicola]TIB96658.1 hypothetical protein E3Q17_03752 [Wallemia mellicola]TIC00493.1 hypothetical protein E3Q16_03960 [Wallemia mellicola]TIC08654.1 hypothetical protein E3Q15_03877 [Wallemia mellicola]TIC09411.1 hypothetical protein E3Q14_03385 [Wallemia mellicola]
MDLNFIGGNLGKIQQTKSTSRPRGSLDLRRGYSNASRGYTLNEQDDYISSEEEGTVRLPASRFWYADVPIFIASDENINISRTDATMVLNRKGNGTPPLSASDDKLTSPQLSNALFTSNNYSQHITPPESPPNSSNKLPPSRQQSHADFHHDIHHINNKSNLTEWAPAEMAKPPPTQRRLHNLPDWNLLNKSENHLTAHPISLIQADLEWSLRHLMSEQVFEQLLTDSLGRYRFRQFLETLSPDSVSKLDCWTDTTVYDKLVNQIRAGSEVLYQLYLSSSSPNKVTIPPVHTENTFISLQKLSQTDSGLEPMQQHLLTSLYENEFQQFVRFKLVERAKVRLGKAILSDREKDGLSDAFVITNPRLRDHPIVMASDGFSKVTGYHHSTIIGRNCRFLQGPGTAPQSVQRIRDALNNGVSITELLLNYRADGTPFFCLLNMIPLHDSQGKIAYFIGGQVNVTGILSSSKNLSFLLGSTNNDPQSIGLIEDKGLTFSPTMSRFGRPEGEDEDEDNEYQSLNTKTSSMKLAAGQSLEVEHEGDMLTNSRSSQGVSGGMTMGSRMKKFFSKNRPTDQLLTNNKTGQRLYGAENLAGSEPKPLESQLAFFEHTYTKLMVIKRNKREIVFLTPDLLQFLGLPTKTSFDRNYSTLHHASLTSVLSCGPKRNAETKALKELVKDAFKRGEPLSTRAGIRYLGKAGLFQRTSATDVRHGVLHLTPMLDREGQCFAYAAVFS